MHWLIAHIKHLFGGHCYHKVEPNWIECCVCRRGMTVRGGGRPY
jgi:hypothetical protein